MNFIKSWLQNNRTEMHSTHNEGKPAVTERFIKTIKNKSYKYITSFPIKCLYLQIR